MKEISIEEKARLYDEAIERANKMLSDKEIKYLFPELKEGDRIRKEIITHFKAEQIRLKDSKRYNSWLTWLEKQSEHSHDDWIQELEDKLANATPKQLAEWKEKYFKEESAEWIEEDEKMLDDAIGAINAADYYTYDDKQEIGNWLKSLKDRYTWKPTDEQMDVLEQWLKDNQYKGDARYCYPIFESLYQDLKKLKEG